MKTIKSFFQWVGTFLEEDSGKGSSKRLGFLLIMVTVCSIFILYAYRDHSATYDWTKCAIICTPFFAFAAALIGAPYIPTRFGKNTPDTSPTDAPKA